MAGWSNPQPPPATAEQPVDPFAMLLRDHLIDAVWMACHTTNRSLQAAVGASEVGNRCERALALKATGTAPVHFSDPLRPLVGTGLHIALAEHFRRLDGGAGRYLVEQDLLYRGIPGSADLYDRRRRVVVDWKSPLLRKVKQTKANGPSMGYVDQVHIYGAALRAMGEAVDSVALAYLPADGKLTDMHVWTSPLRVEVADAAIDRYERIAAAARESGAPALPASPSALCNWCDYYRPGTTELTVACPGDTTT